MGKQLPLITWKELFGHTEHHKTDSKRWLCLGSDAWVVAFTGIRGSGKSLSMAYWIAAALAYGLRVWSNMSVDFRFQDKRKSIRELHTEPLDTKALLSLSGELRDGVVAIDEFQYYADNRSSMSIRNRLINAILYQVRKRSLSFFLTIKDAEWLDVRLRAMELDLQVNCMDMHLLNPSEHRKGEDISWYIWDRSGAWSGFPNSPPYEPNSKQLFRAKRCWHIYDTSEVIDYINLMSQVRVDNVPIVVGNRAQIREHNLNDVYSVAYWFVSSMGMRSVNADDFLNKLDEYSPNAQLTTEKLGRYMAQIGGSKRRTRQGTIYDLDGLVAGEERK